MEEMEETKDDFKSKRPAGAYIQREIFALCLQGARRAFGIKVVVRFFRLLSFSFIFACRLSFLSFPFIFFHFLPFSGFRFWRSHPAPVDRIWEMGEMKEMEDDGEMEENERNERSRGK